MAQPGRAIEYVFPTKGVVNIGARQQQPDLSAPAEALSNMMPFDRTGRARGAQRPGTARLFAAALAAAPVMMLGQTVTPLDPTTLPTTYAAVNEGFTQYLPQGSPTAEFGTHNGGNWTVVNDQSNFYSTLREVSPTYASVGAATIDANGLYANSGNPCCCIWSGSALALSGGYALQATLTGLQVGVTDGISFFFRRNASAAHPNQFIIVTVNFNSAVANSTDITDDFGSIIGTGAALGSGWSGTHTVRVTVVGNTFTVFVDGVQKAQGTTTNAASNAQLGFIPSYGGVSSTARIQNISVQTADPRAVYRKTNLVAACNGNVYIGDPTGTMALATNGAAVLTATAQSQLCFSQGNAYIVDGTSTLKLTLSSSTVSTLTATAGTIPTGCTLCCMYRDRLVLAAPTATPWLFFCSRLGTATDFDYTQIDAAAAFAGNASTAGHLGDPITALMPHGDDVLLIGGDHTLYAIKGDPAQGGSIDLISDSIGVLGPNAWCKSPDGTIYFAGTGGLYRVKGEAMDEIAGGKYLSFFQNIDRARSYICLTWDRDRHGMWITVCPILPSTQLQRNLWYDERTDAFFPMGFPDSHGPIATCTYDADTGGGRTILMGGRTGLIQRIGDSLTDDDGTAFNAAVLIGPSKIGADLSMYGTNVPGSDLNVGLINGIDVILGEVPSGFTEAANWNCVVELLSGSDAQAALNAPTYDRSRTYAKAGRQPRWIIRQRGTALWLKLSNAVANKFFSFERATAWVVPAGKERH